MRAVHPTEAIYGNIPFGHNYDCVTFLWPRRLVWSSAHYNFCLSLSFSPFQQSPASKRASGERTPSRSGLEEAWRRCIRKYAVTLTLGVFFFFSFASLSFSLR